MSYFILTSLSINNNGNDIFVTGDDNNVFPKDYTRSKYGGNLYDLIYDFWSGGIQPTKSANNGKALYLSRLMSESIGVGWGVERNEVYEIIKSKRLDVLFLQVWNDRNKSNETYKVMYGDSCVTSLTKYGFKYSKYSKCKIFNYYQAKNIIADNEKQNLKMIKM